jgi:hypothetical protein
MQGTAEFHHQIADARHPQAEPVCDDTTALATPVDRLDPQPAVREGLIRQFLLQCQLLATWCLGRHDDRHLSSTLSIFPEWKSHVT